ncbi:MAG: replicative DNA helicase [Candidatus Doudnabacteria bacterium]|nr:replicative DNA helicase [Candidatus Doudnabacteria bacterium]
MDTQRSPVLDRLPPQNLEAESSVLGALMLDKDGIIKIADIVIADDFYDNRHKQIFEAILKLFEKNTSIDILTVSNYLEERKILDRIGGSSYLTQLVNLVPSAANIVYYANIVRKKGTLRRLIQASGDITTIAYSEEGEVEDVLDRAEQRLYDVSQKHLKQNFIPVNTVLHETFERIDQLHRDKGALRGLASGYIDLDKLLGGLQKSDLIILAARPSMGKTAFALDMIRNVSVNFKIPTGIFSLEMSKDQLVDRLLASQSGVDLWKIRTGNLTDDDFTRLEHGMGQLAEAPIYIDDAAGSNIMEVRTKARRLQSEHGVGLIVIDYLQLMSGRSNSDNRVQEVSEISRSLKILARELNVPVIALSQLSRNLENRPDKIPQLSDLRESGSIEQDADVVMFIYREDMYKGKESSRPNIAEIHIKKHRNGPTGQVDLFFDAAHTSFKNLDQSFDTRPQVVMQALESNEDTID